MRLARREILVMQPGPEMDVLVASHIFGQPFLAGQKSPPRFSTSYYDAGLLLRKLQMSYDCPVRPVGNNYLAGVIPLDISIREIIGPCFACGETFMEAICKAALLAAMGNAILDDAFLLPDSMAA